ncbi:putative ribonuclease H protein [Glycine soja]
MGKFWGDLVVEEESDTGKEDQDALAFGAQFQRVISKSKKRSWSKGRRKLTPKGSTIPAVGMILKIIEQVWGQSILSCPMFILTHKLKLLKVALKSWNKDSFGNIPDLVDRAKNELSLIKLFLTGFLRGTATPPFIRWLKLGMQLALCLLFKSCTTPTYVLFADDIMVFCKGNLRNLHNLMAILKNYGEALGVPIFKRKLKKVHLQGIIDKILTKLASWKGAMLSIMGRVQLVPLVIQDSRWCIGDGTSINFWMDNWLSKPLVDELGIPNHLHSRLNSKVTNFIYNGKWCIPPSFADMCPTISIVILSMVIPLDPCVEKQIWTYSLDGEISHKLAVSFVSPPQTEVGWGRKIWSPSVPPSKSFLLCQFLQKMKTCVVKVLQHKGPFSHPLIDVLLQPLLLGWLKCNIDGATQGYPGRAAKGGVFRNSLGSFVGTFADLYRVASSFHAKLLAAIKAMEIAYNNGWFHLWLEVDSKLVVYAFNSPHIVP